MKKTAEKGKKIVFGVLLVLACILMPQKFRNMPGSRQLKAQMTDLRKN